MNLFNTLEDVMGAKVNLEEISSSWGDSFFKVNDPSFEKDVAHLGQPVRLWAPGQICSMEFLMGRANIVVDKTGSVVQVFMG